MKLMIVVTRVEANPLEGITVTKVKRYDMTRGHLAEYAYKDWKDEDKKNNGYTATAINIVEDLNAD